MAQATSYATIFLLSLCLAIFAVGQELEFEGSAAAPDFFDLEYEFEAVDAVYETPDDDYDESDEAEREDEQPEDEQPEDEYEEPEEDEITEEPEPQEPEEDEEVEEPEEDEDAEESEEDEDAEESEEDEDAEESEEDEDAEKVTESDEEAEETEADDGELNVTITEEEFPGCSTFDQSAQALYLPEHVLWSVRLEDATDCCEICGAYLECQMWTMDRSELLCTLLVTDEVETRQNPEWATGYKEL